MPIADRIPIIDRRLAQPRMKSRRSISLLMTVVLTSSLAIVALLQLQQSNDVPELPAPERIAYFVHAPIFINGNAGFLADNMSTGVSWGSGTASDPYIIENWDIDAFTADGIRTQDTDVHFIIRNCRMLDGGSNYNGIYLSNCVNGRLESNFCLNCLYGLRLDNSNGNILSNNTCTSNRDGVHLTSSSDNALRNNTCNSNLDSGIYLYLSCNGNTLSNNTCDSNSAGMYVYVSSNDNTLNNNTCNSNGVGIYIGSSSGNMLMNNTCLANGGGIYLYSASNNNTLINNNCLGNSGSSSLGIYLFSSNDNLLSNNTCILNYNFGITFYASNSNTLFNNSCSNGGTGMRFDQSNNNTINNNTCGSNSANGIYLYQSRNNEIAGNWIGNNARYGVYIEIGRYNQIWNNSFVGNNGAGNTYDTAHVQAYDDRPYNHWNVSGYGNFWSDWTTPDNDMNGVVDNPYNISGLGEAKDYYPRTISEVTPIPEFSSSIVLLCAMVAMMAVVVTMRRVSPRKSQ